MAKLVLKFDERVLQESAIGSQGVRIGRSPDNNLVIDNPAVSSRHARVIREGGSFVLEDLNSTNGTFVNEKRVTRHTLHDGDSVLIGKHTIEFDLLADEPVADEPEAGPAVPDLGGTRVLDTEHHKALMAKWEKEAQAKKAPTGTTRVPAATAGPVPTVPKTERPLAPARIGVLRVLAGHTDGTEYKLSGVTSLIGKADTSLVRLKGWFKPKVAVAIARKGEDYSATALGGKTLINGQRLSGRQDLKDGDVLEVSGVTLEFRLQ